MKCLEYIKNNKKKFNLICTDSKSLTDALINKNILRSNYNILKIYNLLYDLYINDNTVDIVWIPAHQGIIGNTMADYEAKQASKFSTTSNEKIIWSDFLVDQKCKTLKLWQETWEKDNKVRHLYKIKQNPR